MFCVPPHGAHQAVSVYCTAITFSAACAGACSLSATGDDRGLIAHSLVEASKALQGVLCQNEWGSSDFSMACARTASEGGVCAVGRAAPSACWATPRLWQQTKHAWMTRSTSRGQASARACDQLLATLLLLARKEAAPAALTRCKRVLALDQRGAEAHALCCWCFQLLGIHIKEMDEQGQQQSTTTAATTRSAQSVVCMYSLLLFVLDQLKQAVENTVGSHSQQPRHRHNNNEAGN